MKSRLILVFALLAAVAASPAAAQQTESRISGRILDQSKAALPGVTVTVTSKATGAVRTAITDVDGSYTVTTLGPGAYVVTTDLAGFTVRTREVVLGVGGLQYQYSSNKGTTQGSNEAATTQNTFDYETEYGTNPQDIPHTFNGSLTYLIPGDGLWRGGWRIGGIVNARSGVPINVVMSRPDNATVNGVTVANIIGGNSRGTQRPDLVPGVDPYLPDAGVRWLNPAAFATPQPGTFGNLPRNFLRGPNFWPADLMMSKDFRFGGSQSLQVRAEFFNILNRLNYENPAATLPNGTPGAPITDAQAGTFGYMLGPLNRTVGLGTARQTQLSVRYSF